MKGKSGMRTLEIAAKRENLEKVISFINDLLKENGCSAKEQIKIEVTVEEIFVNIASHAYAPGTGNAVINAEVSGEPKTLTMIFEDGGARYDPVAKEDPDITLPISERKVGGLGIFLVKKNMDYVNYEYKDGKNILTLKKVING